MPEFSAMANRAPKNRDFRNRVFDRLERRTWPIAVSALFVLLQLLFLFRWGSVVEHIPKLWLCGQDFWITYLNSSQFVHGHFGAIYQAKLQFLEPPGILLALAPLGAFSGSFHSNLYQIVQGRAIPLPDIVVHVRGFNAPFIYPKEIFMHGGQYVLQTQWTEFVYPYVLALFCTVLFACDALAERMQVGRSRRATLCVVEAVLLWNLALSQHPEDAVAVALAVYALIFALDRRFVGAGWLFGAALAFQPLVILMMPVLMAMAGRKRMLGFVIRSVLPAAVLLAPSFIAAFSATFRALAEQPNYPNQNHATPWTALSPHLGGQGIDLAVAGGPGRVVAILLAVLVGIWVARRCLERPELIVFACALAFALRTYTESVLDAYYPWAALTVGVAVAARCSARRFGIAIGLAVATSVMAQWMIAWFPWWAIQVTGLTALLAVAYPPASLQAPATSVSERKRLPVDAQQERELDSDKQRPGRGAVAKQLGSKTANTRAPAQAQSSSAAIRAMQKAAKNEKTKSKTVADTRKSPNTKATPKQKGPPTHD